VKNRGHEKENRKSYHGRPDFVAYNALDTSSLKTWLQLLDLFFLELAWWSWKKKSSRPYDDFFLLVFIVLINFWYFMVKKKQTF